MCNVHLVERLKFFDSRIITLNQMSTSERQAIDPKNIQNLDQKSNPPQKNHTIHTQYYHPYQTDEFFSVKAFSKRGRKQKIDAYVFH